MQQKYLVIGIVLIAIVGFVFLGTNKNTPATPNNTDIKTPEQNPVEGKGIVAPVSTEYTLTQVATHNKKTDCWTTINGGVYNVTSWIDEHPGGADAIISLCGIDGSSAFVDQHSGQKRPANELATFKIGNLK
jgi:cytochrome b involved in lipid metabolism